MALLVLCNSDSIHSGKRCFFHCTDVLYTNIYFLNAEKQYLRKKKKPDSFSYFKECGSSTLTGCQKWFGATTTKWTCKMEASGIRGFGVCPRSAVKHVRPLIWLFVPRLMPMGWISGAWFQVGLQNCSAPA